MGLKKEKEMPKRVTIKAHLSIEELEHRYQENSRPTEKRAWQIIWLMARGKKTEEVADFLGLTSDWVRKLIKRYNDNGPDNFEDRRKHNKGRPPLLTEEQLQKLTEAVKKSHPDGGLWSGPKVAIWMSEELGRKVSRHRAWEYLKKK